MYYQPSFDNSPRQHSHPIAFNPPIHFTGLAAAYHRVHAAHLGHPLLGDATYHTPAAPPAPAVHAVAATLGRPALHAHTLAFAHPTTGATLTFTSPVPPDLVDAVRALRSIGS